MQVSMLRGIAVGASAVLGLALIAPSARAQAQTNGMRFGVEAAFATNNSVGIGAGAFLKFHLVDVSEHPITGRVSFDYYFPSSSNFAGFTAHYWEIEADGLFDIVANGDTKPYVGAGLTYGHWSYGYDATYCGTFANLCSASTSNTGLDIVGGINFMGGSKLMPFVEAKIELSSGSEFIIKGGIHFK
jgi:opacity protein-like surface antigen